MTDSLIKSSINGSLCTVQLNRAKALNALNLEMIEQLTLALKDAFENPIVKTIWLESTSDRAFCAGGDVKALVSKLMEAGSDAEREQIGKRYFSAEYPLDLMIEKSPKPIVVLADGIVFGGGWGLYAGANLRLVTEKAKFAMPEIQIGLFPDVGAANFLQKTHWKQGTLLGISGLPISCHEAVALDYADDLITLEYADNLKQQLVNGLEVTELDIQSPNLESVAVHEWHDALATLPDDGTLTDWVRLIEDSEFDGFKRAAHSWEGASSWSVALTWHYFEQCRNKTREEVLETDLLLGETLSVHPEFIEGVRAKLIEKDNKPNWLYPHVESVPIQDLENVLKR